MAKQPKKVNPDKKFLNMCRLIFSSLSARSCIFAYFNVEPDGIMLTNSTNPPPNEEHGDKFMDYSVPDLSLHCIHVKDESFIQRLREVLKIDDPDKVYCFQVQNLMSLLNKIDISKLKVFDNEYGHRIMVESHRTTWTKKNIIGLEITNFHVLNRLFYWRNYIRKLGTEEHRRRYPHYEMDMDINPVIVGRVFMTEIDPNKIRTFDDKPAFDQEVRPLKIVNFDGMNVVSIREFIKKIVDHPYTFKRYMWVVNKSYVLSMTTFENEIVRCVSHRPNTLSIPVPSTVAIETQNLLAFANE